jgi:class 3 adenylate cyclase/predicted ATPase
VDFVAVVDQAIALLRQRGRLTYRTLQLQFQLDDAHLEALKDELIKGQRLATDEDGAVLVWTGDTATPVSPASPLALPAPPSAASAPPEAERRQLTVLFCDLVDSTKLSSQLDPEDWRDVVRAYQRVCTDVIQRYDGHIAQLLGDGLLIYFGYPQAHEDDAQRAVRTGLGILDAMGDLNQGLQPAKGIQLAVRVGIHTGLVVVGAMGGAGRQEQLALGETPNIAARIQGLAAPNTVAISEATSRLVQGYFDCEALGGQTLRGVAEPVAVYQVLQESGARGRLDVAGTRGLTPLVGRESEVTLLLERWEQVKAGHGHIVLLTGDAGIGKSRLVQVLKEHVAHEPYMRWECRSLEYYQNTALFPLIDLFQRLLQFHAEDTLDTKLEKLEHALSQYRLPVEESVPLFAPLLALLVPANRYPPLNLSSQRQRQKTLETLVAILQELAEHQPMLFIVEDLHWTDPTTLELLNLVLDQTPTASLLTVLTCRPIFQPSWTHRSYLTEVSVSRLAQPQVAHMVERVAGGKTFPDEVLQQIVQRTDGVPLFIEEMTKAILESGHLKDTNGHYTLTGALPALPIPTTLQDSLMARLDRLMTAKVIAQLGATIGRQFSYELLQAVSGVEAGILQRELGRLLEAEVLYQRGLLPNATYLFKHALIQDTAYQSLLKSTRQQYHQRIAQVLETRFPEIGETQPELLAHHYTEAGLHQQAVAYWHRAGEVAIQRSAYVEARAHLTTGLALVATLPSTLERHQQELTLHLALGSALMESKGYGAPEVEREYTRARELAQQVGDTRQLFWALRGLRMFYLVHGKLQTAHELAEQLLQVAECSQDPALLALAHNGLGISYFYRGELAAAYTHATQGHALYTPEQDRSLAFLCGVSPGAGSLAYAAMARWVLGFPQQALMQSRDAVTLAQELQYPAMLALPLAHAAWLHQFRREWPLTQERAEEVIALATEQGFPFWVAMASVLRGWALTAQGQDEAGIAQMHQGLAAYRATGAEMGQTYLRTLLVEGYGKVGQIEAGLTVLAEALAVVKQGGEHLYEAELYRLKGELLLQRSSDNHTEAETGFHHAIAIAQNQQAKSWELRAITSLARLWQQQGKRQEAHDLLAPVYHWFTEGFDTADLKDAKALLEELA